MITVKICVGSSCHLRGSADVVEAMVQLVKKYKVEDKIELQASFCLGYCQDGVTLKADEIFVHKLNKENVEEKFLNEILPLIKE